MSAVTPGPWAAHGSRIAADARGNTRLAVVLDEVLARTYGNGSHANARLIAAAPELAELVQWMVKRIDDYPIGVDESDWMRKARAALAKAAV